MEIVFIFLALRRQGRGAVEENTVALVLCSNMGMLKPMLLEKESANATANKTTTYATAKSTCMYRELVLKRRGLRGLLRLIFAKDLRSRFYRCAGGKELLQKAGEKMQYDLQEDS
jgi:hypothetical protein